MNTNFFLTAIPFHVLVVLLPISMAVLYKKPHLWNVLFALFLGLLTGYVNFHTDEMIFPVLLLLVFGLFFGFSEPQHAWRWVLLLFVWIPLGQFYKMIIESSFDTFTSEGLVSFISIIPAAIGTYCGVFIRTKSSLGSTSTAETAS